MAAGTSTPVVTRDAWTLVTVVGTSGLYQNTTGQNVFVREQTADPGVDEKKGHVYENGQGDVFATTLGLWIRLGTSAGEQTAECTVTVTEYA